MFNLYKSQLGKTKEEDENAIKIKQLEDHILNLSEQLERWVAFADKYKDQLKHH